MTLSVDVYWSFRSPYSYLATGRLVRFQADYDLEINLKPVLPLAVRSPEFFQRVNPLFPAYLMRDTVRIAESLGIPYAWPQPDPVVMDRETRTFPKEQPHIHRLTRLGVAAAEHGRGLPFVNEVSRIIFGGRIRGWNDGSHLADATARAGLDLVELDAAIAAAERYDAIISQNQKALEAAGHWGVPTMVFRDEPFFGQDRLDLLLWRLTQHGLEPRADAEC